MMMTKKKKKKKKSLCVRARPFPPPGLKARPPPGHAAGSNA